MEAVDWIRLTAWIALILWGATEGFRTFSCRHPERGRWARWSWTLGAVVFSIHVALAMHFRHGWSHTSAVQETARQTYEVFRIRWGGGVWFNYWMAAVWIGDAVRSWLAATDWMNSLRRPGWVRGFFLFMWFNAAVVFPHGPLRWLGAVVCAGVGILWWIRYRTAVDRSK